MIVSTVSTRGRLLDAALRLFAEHGYAGVTVGQIEEAAGLRPRRGSLYNHFPSKEALLTALVEHQVEKAELAGAEILELLPLGDLRTDLLLLGRLVLRNLEAQSDLLLLMAREARTRPDVIAAARDRIAGFGHRRAVSVFEALFGPRGDGKDVPAIASVALDALVGFWMEGVIFDRPPSGMGMERYLRAWVEMVAATIAAE
jgi:AcrR family transcriptional regulator